MSRTFHASGYMRSDYHVRWQPVPRRRTRRLRAQLLDAATAIALGAASGVGLVLVLSKGV